MTLIRNVLYAILLGVGMAACLSQNEEAATENPKQAEPDTTTEFKKTSPVPDPATLVVAKGRVGNIRLGMPIADVREHVAEGTLVTDTLLQQEGMQATAYLLHTTSDSKGLLIEQHCDTACTVWRINVLGTAFKTPKGIGVGSKYSEVKQAYLINMVAFEEGNFVAFSEEMGISFVLEDTQLPQDYKAKGKYTPENIPANTLVKRMMLY